MQSSACLAAAIAVLILLASAPQSHAAPAGASQAAALSPRPASLGLSGGQAAAPPLQPPPPTYDEQLGASFTQDFSSLAYNVSAVAQTDSDGYGPGYLLNGLTPAGFWYQVGISYHWPDSNGGYDPNFGFSYEVYGANGKTTYPSGGGAGLGSFSGVVRPGDSVLLSLTFVGSTVVMLAKDWSTGASASASYSSEGSSIFVGSASSPTDDNGFFTGLMTEWYHVAPYYGNEEQVTYTNDAVALTSAWMWIDEFQGHSTAPTLFDSQTQSPVAIASGGQVYPFSADGASMYVSAHAFATGASATSSRLTLTPATAATTGGPSPEFSATYTFSSQPQSAAVSAGVNVLEADPGTTITVAIAPSSTSEFWVFNGTSGNKVSFEAGTNATFAYYELTEQTVSYQVAGGGGALPSSVTPELTYEEAPLASSSTPAPVTATQVLGTTPVTILALVGANASVTESIAGAAGERWATSVQNWTISAPDVIPNPIQFYQQYDVSVSYAVMGGGTPLQTPEFNSTAFGMPLTVSVIRNGTTGWFDAGSNYYFTGILNGSTAGERWAWVYGEGFTPFGGCVGGGPCGPGVYSPNQEIVGGYLHQYRLDLSVNDASGGGISGSWFSGAVSQPVDWWVDAGQNLSMTAAASYQWQFEDWSGSGAGAYTGTSPAVNFTAAGPLSENATFYVQLAIAADAGTNVAYSYGSQSGVVQAGTTKTLYVPPTSNVTLRASPSLFVYSFSSWKGTSGVTALTGATKRSLAVAVDYPTAVTGTSSIDYPVVLGTALVAAIVLILAISLWTRNRRRRSYDAFYPG